MKCPKCRNVGWKPTKDLKRPIQNTGQKQHFDTFDTRRYVCFQCGYVWLTKETFYRPVKVRVEQKELFGNAN